VVKKILLAIFLVLVFAGSATGQWDGGGIIGTPPRPPVGRVDSPRTQGLGSTSKNLALWPGTCIVRTFDRSVNNWGKGSGVWMRDTETNACVLVTAWHVMRYSDPNKIVVEFPHSGESFTGKIAFLGSAEFDVATLALSGKPSVPPITVSRTYPSTGDNLTMVGFGGMPRRGFQATAGRMVQQSRDSIAITRGSSQGDSGGPVLDNGGHVVGVISRTSSYGDRDGHTIAACWRPGMLAQIFSRSRCAPREPPRMPQIPQLKPSPVPPPLTDPTMPSPLGAPPVQSCEVDYDKIVEAVLERIQDDPRLKGRDGEKGEPGEKGDPGNAGEGMTEEQVARLVSTIVTQLKTDESFLKSITGSPGEDGQDGEDGDDGEDGEPGATGGKLTKIHVDATGRIYATYDNQRQEVVGDMPFIEKKPGSYEIVPRKKENPNGRPERP